MERSLSVPEEDGLPESDLRATTAGFDDPAEGAVAPHSRTLPAHIGRFALHRRLGAGATGSVYAGHDEQLDRVVAIKVLRRRVSAVARLRVEREARSMAKLSHPNVVQVYEVGDDEAGMFIAMEYVDGRTLEEWQATPRPWREVLAAYRQAAEGLAAAHAVGIIHRDFKPANVMIDRSGRIKVLDFGLARQDESATSIDDDTAVTGRQQLRTSKLTAEGRVLGTPAYMAPEQFKRADVDETADQFSFCVSLWEALHGAAPFEGEYVSQIIRAAHRREFAGSPRQSGVPGWVRNILMRGLSVHPSARWPSMQALIEALDADPGQRRKRWLALASGALGVGLSGAGLHALAQSDHRCSGAEQRLAGVWDDAVEQRIQTAFEATSLPYADQASTRTVLNLDAYTAAWTSMYTATCEATTIHGEQSSQVMELRMACLERAVNHVSAATRILVRGDAGVVQNAERITAALPDLTICNALLDERSDAVDASPMAREVDGMLARAKLEDALGRYERSLALTEEALSHAVHLDSPRLRGELDLHRGRMLAKAGHYSAAEAALELVLESASQRGDVELLQQAASELLYVVGYEQHRSDEALLRYRMLATSLESASPDQRISALLNVASVLYAKGDYAEAEGLHREALEVLRHAASAPPRQEGTIRSNLAGVLLAQGRVEEAIEQYRYGLEIFERTLGPGHPELGPTMSNLGAALAARGALEDAEAMQRQALQIRVRTWGPDHPSVASSRSNLANVLAARGHLEDAEREQRAALRIRQNALGPDHADVAVSHHNLGRILAERGQDEQAEIEYRQAISTWSRILPPGHEHLVSARFNFAACLYRQGRFEQVRDLLEDLAEHLTLSSSDPRRGDYLVLRGRVDWELARTTSDRDEARARVLAGVELFRGETSRSDASAEAQRWLDAHP